MAGEDKEKIRGGSNKGRKQDTKKNIIIKKNNPVLKRGEGRVKRGEDKEGGKEKSLKRRH